MVPLWQKKSVWQVTTIIQPALCHLVTSHFQEIACNWTPKDQIRWPIFLMLLCMIVLTEKTSKFPQPIIFWILVFSCHKMTLITKITWMPHLDWSSTLQLLSQAASRGHTIVDIEGTYTLTIVQGGEGRRLYSSLLGSETTLCKAPHFQWICGKLNQIYDQIYDQMNLKSALGGPKPISSTGGSLLKNWNYTSNQCIWLLESHLLNQCCNYSIIAISI